MDEATLNRTYYAQTNAKGNDVVQDKKGPCTRHRRYNQISNFLQAVMRMRQLFSGQYIEVAVSSALADKLGSSLTLDDLYRCL